jgi:hypothetical protein
MNLPTTYIYTCFFRGSILLLTIYFILVSCFDYSSTLTMKAICSSETLADTQRTALHYISGDETLGSMFHFANAGIRCLTLEHPIIITFITVKKMYMLELRSCAQSNITNTSSQWTRRFLLFAHKILRCIPNALRGITALQTTTVVSFIRSSTRLY